MLFNSVHFLIFLPLVLIAYYLLPYRRRWLLIFVASCYFYMAFVPSYILILFFIILIDFFSGIAIERNTGSRRKLWLVTSLVANILLLAFFKYFNFINENAAALLTMAGRDVHPVNLDIILPIGLSFHTFQSMSYTIEVYRGRQPAEKHLGYFANYVLFFPQMVAGPIERYDRLGLQLRQEHVLRYENLARGFRLILFGLLVKMAVADNLAPLVNAYYAEPEKFGSLDGWLAIVLFSFQIYADFFGYSVIACGAAKAMGIDIMDNFRTPYLSRSVTEFWSRWHISLSTWFRDYLYIPLGGNRVTTSRWIFNIMVVFTVSGLWHGASWTFVAWGALHGLMLLTEKAARKLSGISAENVNPALQLMLVIKTFIVVTIIWIFFRAENFAKALQVIRGCFGGGENKFTNEQLVTPLLAISAMIVLDLLIRKKRFDELVGPWPAAWRWGIYSVLLFALMVYSGTHKYNFIYFQF